MIPSAMQFADQDFFLKNRANMMGFPDFGFPGMTMHQQHPLFEVIRGQQQQQQGQGQGHEGFEVTLKTDGFRPEDFSLDFEAATRKLKVTAKSTTTDENGVKVTRDLERTFDVPEACDSDQLASVFTRDGRLRIAAPVKPKVIPQKVKPAEVTSHQHPEMTLTPERVMPILPEVTGAGMGREKVVDGDLEYRVDLDVEGFDPEDLKVELSADGRSITVSGKHEENSEGSSMSRSIHRSFALPANCKPGEITSSFGANGVLSVRAPKERPAITNKPEAKTVEIRVSKK